MLNIFEPMFDPWSDFTTPSKATVLKNVIRTFTVFHAEIFLKAIASGNLVEAYMIVKRYWFFNLVLGNGPLQ